jgi:hypothetical protein
MAKGHLREGNFWVTGLHIRFLESLDEKTFQLKMFHKGKEAMV